MTIPPQKEEVRQISGNAHPQGGRGGEVYPECPRSTGTVWAAGPEGDCRSPDQAAPIGVRKKDVLLN